MYKGRDFKVVWSENNHIISASHYQWACRFNLLLLRGLTNTQRLRTKLWNERNTWFKRFDNWKLNSTVYKWSDISKCLLLKDSQDHFRSSFTFINCYSFRNIATMRFIVVLHWLPSCSIGCILRKQKKLKSNNVAGDSYFVKKNDRAKLLLN